MDLATLIGLIGGFAIVAVAMFLSSNGVLGMFGDVTSVLIVLLGTLLVTMANFGLSQFLGAIKVAGSTGAWFDALRSGEAARALSRLASPA